MKSLTLIVSLSLLVALTGCGETEAEKTAKKVESFKKAMLEGTAGRPAKKDDEKK